MLLTPDDPRIRLEGVAEVAECNGWWEPRRLPTARLSIHPELLRAARMPAGGRLVFSTDATGFDLEVRVTPVAESAVAGPRSQPAPPGHDEETGLPFDVTVDGELTCRTVIEGAGSLHVDGLPAGRKQIVVWLPQFGFTALGRLTVDSAASQTEPTGARWIAYGSSITQCRQADGPSETWPSLVATRQGWQLTNLGFAAQCHLDPVVARHIRDTPAELISLCLGINIYGRGSFNARSLGPAVDGFLATVRDGHPATPLVVSTPIACPDRETAANAAGLTLGDIRDIVGDSVRTVQQSGDAHLALIDGREILSAEEDTLLVDRLHPGPAGYRLMAERLAPRLAAALKTSYP